MAITKRDEHFRTVTTKVNNPNLINAVIMGRKTWESIPQEKRPLKDRLNVVLTRSKNQPDFPDGVLTAQSLSDALTVISNDRGIETVFVIGGEEVYTKALHDSRLNKIFLTLIDAKFECDSFLPGLARAYLNSSFTLSSCSDEIEEAGVKYQFLVYERQDNSPFQFKK